MGIPIDPFEYGDDCGCFPPGKTPKFMFASAVGIVKTPTWNPGDPNPPNQLFWLEQSPIISCKWDSGAGFPACGVHFGDSWAAITVQGPYSAFWGADLDPCIAHYVNSQGQGPPEKYWKGSLQLMWLPTPGSPSIQEVTGLIGMENEPNTKADFWPVDAQYLNIRFARKKDHTNVLIKYDFT